MFGNVLAAAAHSPHLPSFLQLPQTAAPGNLEQVNSTGRRQFTGERFLANTGSPLAVSGNLGRRQRLAVGPDV